jgi:DNA-binding IclR family transcriptional regulator
VQSVNSRKRPEELQTVGRAARILVGFKEAETVTLSACAAQLGIAKSMAHRLLTTLAEYDLVAFDPDVKAYRIGPSILAMARSVTEGPRISEFIGPLVREAADLTHETITLCKIQGDKGVCVAFADSPHAMRLTVSNGDEYALNAGAIGKCLLAYQADGFLNELAASGNICRYTENTIVEPALLRMEIQKIRAQGFAFSREEMTPGASSIGVPVLEGDGPVRFGLAASGPALRVDDREDEIASLLVGIAKRISNLVCSKKPETKIKET